VRWDPHELILRLAVHPEGPGSVSGAPNLPAWFTDTFTSRYIDTGELRQHAVIGGDGPPLLLVHGWPETSYAWRLLRALSRVGHHHRTNEQRKSRRLTMPVLAIGGAASWGEHVGDAMKLAADDVQSVVIPGTGHWVAETAVKEMLAALTAFLAPYRD
jgi:pimeloyl-ACP methyl ester carboxylesterase